MIERKVEGDDRDARLKGRLGWGDSWEPSWRQGNQVCGRKNSKNVFLVLELFVLHLFSAMRLKQMGRENILSNKENS